MVHMVFRILIYISQSEQQTSQQSRRFKHILCKMDHRKICAATTQQVLCLGSHCVFMAFRRTCSNFLPSVLAATLSIASISVDPIFQVLQDVWIIAGLMMRNLRAASKQRKARCSNFF